MAYLLNYSLFELNVLRFFLNSLTFKTYFYTGPGRKKLNLISCILCDKLARFSKTVTACIDQFMLSQYSELISDIERSISL